MSTNPPIDEAKLNEFMGKMLGDMGAAMNAALVLLGDELGLWKAMAGAGSLTAGQLAEKTGTFPRYVREGRSAQAASGYVTYDPATQTFTLPPEQAMVFAQDDSPVFCAGAFESIRSMMLDEPLIRDAFKSGAGVGWHEHSPQLFSGTRRFFRPGYIANLTTSWIPALEGVEEKLRRGARVADVGCGHGASTILMVEAYPQSQFFGFDYHEPSIEIAQMTADMAGVADRCTFAAAPSKSFPGGDYDLVAFFDCLHDMGDPIGAAAHVRQSLAPDGTWMIVEPMAHDRLENNLNPVGRVFYAASTLICTPASRAQEVGLALGAQAGEARLRDVITRGGFTRFRRATETPFNMILEARV